jgi:endonuclease/exonuclease/phosphatase family metal-dependent hydrolase
MPDAAAPADERQPDQAMKVATWNLWWRFGEWDQRLPAIRSVLGAARPDICGLQEVWLDGDRNLADELAGELGLHAVWVRSPQPERWHIRLPGCKADIANAILSRWPVAERTELRLPPGRSGDASRTALVCVIDSPHGRVPVATTQLTSAPWDSATRCDQVRTLVEALATRASEDHPAIMLGDLNAEPDSDEVRLLCGHKTAPARDRFVLVDAWRYASSTAVPWTWDRRNPHVRSTMEPSSRIDYVLVGPPHEHRRGSVRSIRRIGATPVRGVWPSDHAGLLAALL